MPREDHRPILLIGVVVLAIMLAGWLGTAYFAMNPVEHISLSYWSLSVALVAVGVVTFFGFMWYMQKLGGEWALDKGGMRLAIVASVITVYLVLVCAVSFFTAKGEIPRITETMLTHFTTVVLAVVAFYFGASAYVQVRQKKVSKKEVKEKG